jgi:hypothetical protein
MDRNLEQLVWQRANSICEYCHMPQYLTVMRFQIDHIIAEQHGGLTIADNLALSCLLCNACKGPNIASIDQITQSLVPLFNPRRQVWDEHFKWNGPRLIGLTPIGRATIAVLSINLKARVLVRASLIEEGVFP